MIRAIVALSCACTIAALFVPDLIAGFLSLLRSTLEALFLPFRLLFDLAVWMTTGKSIGTAVSGVGHASDPAQQNRALFHCYIPAALIAAGFLLSLIPPEKHPSLFFQVSLCLLIGASVLIGLPIAVLLAPALVALICTLYSSGATPQNR
ncbi:hypothetical protein [Acetobacter oeni]|uniref:Uncharacterized protein n=1 Tax=Acetobacter oeni TaxID=304077 RepID=A0A511XGV3_9PROT|nr:hypothetical protein [Acetobacter oeni]MBB3882314.1 hypothetical protein [Acetobacter oeni]NHO18581.1 hypothetical protein [Acetobacter oeni]GBR02194.1 hypothetical protein AA21952_0666 [Acetobacter oeni LMG 21952]GEN62176.1 hypothetical protein AOE01nite_04000 [Acetobacter oeni]